MAPDNASVTALEASQAVLVVGTSALVHAASSLPTLALAAGAFVVNVNTQQTRPFAEADACLFEQARLVLPRLIQAVLSIRHPALQ